MYAVKIIKTDLGNKALILKGNNNVIIGEGVSGVSESDIALLEDLMQKASAVANLEYPENATGHQIAEIDAIMYGAFDEMKINANRVAALSSKSMQLNPAARRSQ